MKLKLWGTRGSLPRAMTHDLAVGFIGRLVEDAMKQGVTKLADFKGYLQTTAKPLTFGGNTSCNEVIFKSARCFVDMGTGICEAGAVAMAAGIKEFHIFQTHLHWDHIIGLPFFVPIYTPGHKIVIHHVHKHAPDYIKIQFNGINFPVKWEQIAAHVEFVQLRLYEPFPLKDLTVTPFSLDHPGGSFGYRFDSPNHSLAIGVDGEYKRLTPKELGADLKFYQNLDLLVFDAQYEMDELASRFDWGHCSPPIGVDLALREGIRRIILTHHDPRSTDDKSHRMLAQAKQHLAAQLATYRDVWWDQPEGPRIESAYDGMEVDLES